jgi:hypothetical protein
MSAPLGLQFGREGGGNPTGWTARMDAHWHTKKHED